MPFGPFLARGVELDRIAGHQSGIFSLTDAPGQDVPPSQLFVSDSSVKPAELVRPYPSQCAFENNWFHGMRAKHFAFAN